MGSTATKASLHPLKRKSVKPSSSTVRGMLPGRQFRALDAAMQSLRAAGLRLEWEWRDRDIGWVCRGFTEEVSFCELQPTKDPLMGQVLLGKNEMKKALASSSIPAPFKAILKAPMEEVKGVAMFEFELMSTPERDLFSAFVEALQGILLE